MKTLVIAEHDGHHLKSATRHAVTAARQLGDTVEILVCGHHTEAVAAVAARIDGVGRVLSCDDAAYDKTLPEQVAPVVQTLGNQYDVIIAAATSFGKNLLPRVAALLDTTMVSDVMKIESPDTFVRQMYAGSIFATVQVVDPIKILTVRTTSFPAAVIHDGAIAPVESLSPVTGPARSRWVSTELRTGPRPELTGARIVVAGGRALGSAETFSTLLEPLADALGAAIGATRAAVDAGYAPNEWQVGQTGVVVAPELYIAIGISGAVQHLVGMKESKVIVAINSDPDAPIFQIADYGLVGDLFEAIPELSRQLNSSLRPAEAMAC
jgi:electron transfer flavoprotein alpha subunit